ncbi:MAG: peroxidase family protein [Actinomycetota bacterium]
MTRPRAHRAPIGGVVSVRAPTTTEEYAVMPIDHTDDAPDTPTSWPAPIQPDPTHWPPTDHSLHDPTAARSTVSRSATSRSTTSDPADESSTATAPTRWSRRSMLGALGAGASVAATTMTTPGPASAGRSEGRRTSSTRSSNRDAADDGEARAQPFTRMFDEPAFAEPSEHLTEALAALGAPGGPMDARDPLDAGPEALFQDPALSVGNPDNPTMTAGMTFVGQFIDHDLTLDATSLLNQPTNLKRSINVRTARFDLDSVYGGGPELSPELYDDDDPFRLRVESGGVFEDLPRNGAGQAVMGDPRNDENMMLNGLHCAFLLAHNAALDRHRTSGRSAADAFDQARRELRWHYQWLVVHEWLPHYVGQTMVTDIVERGRRFYVDTKARIPVEFSTACFRFGHSMVRPSYRANFTGNGGAPFVGFVFDPTISQSETPPADPDDLSGGHRSPRRFIAWQTFFDFGDGNAAFNKRIDTRLSTPLFQLPLGIIASDRGEPIGPASLASRNLLRHVTFQLPSGQRLAQRMGAPVLSAADLSELEGFGAGLQTNTPLFFYVLREAELVADGLHLGPVGGRIVAEVFIGLLELDRTSYVNARDPWTPTWPIADDAVGFRTTDLLRFAGVDPSARGQ